MYGFKPGAKPEEKAPKGKKIVGPGTGTSDSIPAKIPKGSYIMPADSTKQIGQPTLDALGKPVPVKVSNGEYQMPPEQVHAVGVQTLNQMRDATHVPAAGFKPQASELYFADGGSPSEEERKRMTGNGPSPQMGAVALGEQRRDERTGGAGLYSQANADLGRAAATAFPNTATAIRGAGQNIEEAYQVGGLPAAAGATVRNTLVPAIGFAADVGRSAKQALDPFANALKTAVTGDPTPIEGTRPPAAPRAAEPAASDAAESASPATAPPDRQATPLEGYTYQPDPNQGPATGMSVRPTSAQGISRIDNAPGLKSPLFTNLPAGQAVSEMQGGTVNTVPAAAMMAAGPATSRATSAALQAAAARGDWDAVRGFYQQNGGTWQGRTAQQDADERQATAGGAIGSGRYGFRFTRRSEDRAADRAVAERRARTEESIARERLGIERGRADTEATTKGFETRGLERMEKLYAAYENAKTPEERAAAAEQIRAMNGREAPNRFTVVPGGQEFDESARMVLNRPAMVLNNQTGQAVDLGSTARQPAPLPNHIAALKKNPNQAAQFDAIYGEGAAARYLGAN